MELEKIMAIATRLGINKNTLNGNSNTNNKKKDNVNEIINRIVSRILTHNSAQRELN